MIFRFADELISSDIKLALPRVYPDTAVRVAVDLSVRRSPRPHAPPLTDLMIRGQLGTQPLVVGCREGDDDWVVVAPPYGVATISHELRRITFEAHESVPNQAIAEFVVSWLLVFRLAIRGQSSFHGSAVALGDRAFAAIGDSGAGKSTFAASLVSRGGVLLADDTLATEHDTKGFVVLSTSAEVRLRHLGDQLAPVLDPGGLHTALTTDGRVTVSLDQRVGSRARLDRILLLNPSTEPGAERVLPPPLAVERLMANAKIMAWADVSGQAMQFDAACELCDALPVIEVATPHRFDSIERAGEYYWSLCDPDDARLS